MNVTKLSLQDFRPFQKPLSYPGAGKLGSHKLYRGMWKDALLAESAVPAIRDGDYLEDNPLVVVSAGEEDGSFPRGKRARFTEMHSEMAESISSQGEHRIIEGADHFSIVTDRQHAEIAAGTVEEVVEQARTE